MGLVPGLAWLAHARPVERSRVVCHGDLPLNVLMRHGRIASVVDWSSSYVRIGEREYDVGATAALIGLGPVDLPEPLMIFVHALRRRLVSRHARAYAKQQPLEPERLRYYEALRLLAFLTESGVFAAARSGAIAPSQQSDPFGSPALQRRIGDRFQELTSVRVTLH